MKVMLVSPVFPGSLGAYCRRALEELGHKVLVFDYRGVAYGADHYKYKPRSVFKKVYFRIIDPVNRMNRALLVQAVSYQPELIIVIKGDMLAPETIRGLSEEKGIATVLWYPDSATFLDTRLAFRTILMGLQYYTICFFGDVAGISPTVRSYIKRLEYLTFGCDPTVHKKWDLTNAERELYGSDICFVGNSHGDDSIRDTLLKGLGDYNVKIWGRGWERRDLYKLYPNKIMRPAYGDELARIYSASKIALNINGNFPYPNVRNFEAPACGIMLLTSELEQLPQYFKVGREVITFTDLPDLRYKIEYYLENENERIEIARAGQERALRDHTVRHRVQEMLAALGETVGSNRL